jgi:hypothetical protein
LYKPFQPAALFEAIGVALTGAAPLAPARQRH